MNTNGYLRVTAGPQRNRYVHMLVMEAKLGRELLSNETVDHIDGNRLNNDWRNLRVVERDANAALAVVRTCERLGVKAATWARELANGVG